MNKEEAILEMNRFGKEKIPFLFIIDFEQKDSILKPFPVEDPDFFFTIGDRKKEPPTGKENENTLLKVVDSDREKYERAFRYVQDFLNKKEVSLLNLTQPTEVEFEGSFLELYRSAKAPYKLFYKNQFLVYSPEPFIKIEKREVKAFPMKGTISADLRNAKEKLRKDEKEIEEHEWLIALLKEDLKKVATDVKVVRKRYFDLIKTKKGMLWETSSELKGCLAEDFPEKIGTLLFSLLPAGSILGYPKDRSLQILKEAEQYDRGYYTGVFGYFDGNKMESAVMIRFLENRVGKYIYKSGGGITAKSELEKEYRELIQKIYVPTA